jgi:DNA-binding response OmpR family regulator
MNREKILVAEDDESILEGLSDLLSGEGYLVIPARDGNETLKAYHREKPDLLLLDIMMPGITGYDVCRDIRKNDPVTPIVMLTAKGQEIEKVIGLELGADDYIVKPFGVQELLARIRAALRRASAQSVKEQQGKIVFGDVEIDPKTYTGKKPGTVFPLTLRELNLIKFFYSHDGEVLDRFTILDEIWGIRYEGTTRTLDQHIARLRQKIEDNPSDPRYILTVHTVGYKFCSGQGA